jgi:hypothetical protein
MARWERVTTNTHKEKQIKKQVVSKLLYGPLCAVTFLFERVVKTFGMSLGHRIPVGILRTEREEFHFSLNGSYKKVFPDLLVWIELKLKSECDLHDNTFDFIISSWYLNSDS